jgi:hypothetical protein
MIILVTQQTRQQHSNQLFSMMIEDRPYRAAWEPKEVLSLIEFLGYPEPSF